MSYSFFAACVHYPFQQVFPWRGQDLCNLGWQNNAVIPLTDGLKSQLD